MATNPMSLEERLSVYPQLRERIEALLAIVEDPAAITRADEVERQVIAEVRRMGNAALCSWAAHQEAAQRATVGQQGTARAGKKNSTGIRRLGK